MFGHLQANIKDLSCEETIRYKSVYCGLCRKLGDKYGLISRLGLTYDLTFLILLLSSLYEPDEISSSHRCFIHPAKKHLNIDNIFVDYAADITIALNYYKCLDDWNDDRKLTSKYYSNYLKNRYEQVKVKLPQQCTIIEKELKNLYNHESNKSSIPDLAANSFGRLMSALFVYKDDMWKSTLSDFGFELGRFIYIADAVIDYEKDLKKKNYNPLIVINSSPETQKPVLLQILGKASAEFEKLPLIKDIHLLRNILYSGIWIRHNQYLNNRKDNTDDQ